MLTGTKPFSLSLRQESSAFSDPKMCLPLKTLMHKCSFPASFMQFLSSNESPVSHARKTHE